MTAPELIQSLAQQGAQLRAEGNQLKIDAPRGVVTPELKATLLELKPALLELLQGGREDRSSWLTAILTVWPPDYVVGWGTLTASYQRAGHPQAVSEHLAFETLAEGARAAAALSMRGVEGEA
jgi:hypothetical protein